MACAIKQLNLILWCYLITSYVFVTRNALENEAVEYAYDLQWVGANHEERFC